MDKGKKQVHDVQENSQGVPTAPAPIGNTVTAKGKEVDIKSRRNKEKSRNDSDSDLQLGDGNFSALFQGVFSS